MIIWALSKEHLDSINSDRFSISTMREIKATHHITCVNCAYLRDFSQKKIIYPNQTTHLSFYLDTEGYYINQKAYMIVGRHLGYLTAFFNSALFRYCFTDNFPIIQGAGREMNEEYLSSVSLLKMSPMKRMQNTSAE